MGGGTLPRAEGILLFGSSLNFSLAKKSLAPAVPRGLHLFYVRLPGEGVNPHRIWRCFGEVRGFLTGGNFRENGQHSLDFICSNQHYHCDGGNEY